MDERLAGTALVIPVDVFFDTVNGRGSACLRFDVRERVAGNRLQLLWVWGGRVLVIGALVVGEAPALPLLVRLWVG